MKISVFDGKKYTKFSTPDNKVVCLAFKNGKSLKVYFHKDYNAKVKSLDGCALKSNIATKPDDYEYTMLVKPSSEKETPLQALKALLSKNVLEKPQFVNADSTKKPETKASAPKKSKKKPELVFKQIKNGDEKKEEAKA